MKLQTIHYLKKNAGIKSVSEMAEDLRLRTNTISGYAAQLKISLRMKYKKEREFFNTIISRAASR